MVNTKACTKPTNNSRPNIGKVKKEKRVGKRNMTTDKSTSPANILPNRRNEKEMILANSKINSNIPTNKFTGFEMSRYFFICDLKPKKLKPKYNILWRDDKNY